MRVLALMVAAAALLPLGYVVWTTAALGPGEAYAFLARDRVGQLLWNTARLVVAGVALSALLGVSGAWLVERSDLPAKGLWHGLLCAPLAVPAFVNGYAWVATTHAVQSYAGAVLVVSLSYYPLVYLPTVAALRRADPALEEVAASLGQGRWGSFRRTVLPAVAPAALGGSLLVALHLLAEYGALKLLNYPTLTTAVLEQYGTAFNGPAATLLAAVLLALCLLLLLGEARWRGGARRARVGSGAPRPAEQVRLGRARPVALLGLAVLVALALAVPLTSLARWLVRGSSAGLDLATLGEATLTTVVLALVAGVVTTLCAVPVVWGAVRGGRLLDVLAERAAYTTSALPGIVVALALVTVSIRWLPGLYQTFPVLVAGYVVLFLPRALVSVRAGLELAPPRLEEVAGTLGCGRYAAFARVTVPLLLPALATSVALLFLAVSTELTATLLLAPLGTSTLSTAFWTDASQVAYGAAAPYALALILLSLPATVLLGRVANGGSR